MNLLSKRPRNAFTKDPIAAAYALAELARSDIYSGRISKLIPDDILVCIGAMCTLQENAIFKYYEEKMQSSYEKSHNLLDVVDIFDLLRTNCTRDPVLCVSSSDIKHLINVKAAYATYLDFFDKSISAFQMIYNPFNATLVRNRDRANTINSSALFNWLDYIYDFSWHQSNKAEGESSLKKIDKTHKPVDPSPLRQTALSRMFGLASKVINCGTDFTIVKLRPFSECNESISAYIKANSTQPENVDLGETILGFILEFPAFIGATDMSLPAIEMILFSYDQKVCIAPIDFVDGEVSEVKSERDVLYAYIKTAIETEDPDTDHCIVYRQSRSVRNAKDLEVEQPKESITLSRKDKALADQLIKLGILKPSVEIVRSRVLSLAD